MTHVFDPAFAVRTPTLVAGRSWAAALRRFGVLVSVGALVAGCAVEEGEAPGATSPGDAVSATSQPGMSEPDVPASSGSVSDRSAADVRGLGAHVHGDAALSVVLEGGALVVELETPLYNLLGFETAPQTADAREAVAAAERALGAPGELFAFDAEAGCVADPVAAEAHRLFGAGAAGQHEGAAHEDDHNDDGHHGDGHHDPDHQDDDDHDHTDGDATHSDLRIRYGFTCERPGALTRVEATLFEDFPRMTSLDGVFLGPDAQASFSLTPARPRARLGN